MSSHVTTMKDFVSSLKEDEMILIIENYEKFEIKGFIGREPLRKHAEKFIEINNLQGTCVVTWMESLAFECYRHFYKMCKCEIKS